MSDIHTYTLRLKQGLIAIEKLIASTSILLLLSFTLIQLVARNFYDTGFPWLDILSRHLVLFIAFTGAALVSEKGNHIKIDILSVFLSHRQKHLLLRPLLILSALICGVFAWYSARFWLDEWSHTTPQEHWTVLLALILPLGFIILSLHFSLLTITGIPLRASEQEP